MSHKPKPVINHYKEAFEVNSRTLARQLSSKSVSANEIALIINKISDIYNKKSYRIDEECKTDIMALENSPSPLRLFVACIGECINNLWNNVPANNMTSKGDSTGVSSISNHSRTVLNGYIDAWEDWMY